MYFCALQAQRAEDSSKKEKILPAMNNAPARRKKSSRDSLVSKTESLGGSGDLQQDEPVMATVSGRGLVSTSKHARSNYRWGGRKRKDERSSLIHQVCSLLCFMGWGGKPESGRLSLLIPAPLTLSRPSPTTTWRKVNSRCSLPFASIAGVAAVAAIRW